MRQCAFQWETVCMSIATFLEYFIGIPFKCSPLWTWMLECIFKSLHVGCCIWMWLIFLLPLIWSSWRLHSASSWSLQPPHECFLLWVSGLWGLHLEWLVIPCLGFMLEHCANSHRFALACSRGCVQGFRETKCDTHVKAIHVDSKPCGHLLHWCFLPPGLCSSDNRYWFMNKSQPISFKHFVQAAVNSDTMEKPNSSPQPP